MSRALLGVVAGTLLLSGCVSGGQPEPIGPEGLPVYYEQTLDWTDCGQNECATLTVPKDYSDLTVGDMEIALLRSPASQGDRGTLVVNPGGPGGSGTDYAAAASSIVGPEVAAQFDIVGFDPRGVGRSQPVKCLTDEELDEWLALDGNPSDAAEVEQLRQAAAGFGARCAAESPDTYAYVSSAAVVKDMDILRAALGEEQLDYLGKSYGTALGAMYAEEYPDRVGRFVLDGMLDPALSAQEVAHGQAKGFEDTLRRFVAKCQRDGNCPLRSKDVDGGVAEIQEFLDGLADEPLQAQPDRPLTQSLGLGAILYYLYFPSFGDWDKLEGGLRDAFNGDGSTLLTMYDERLDRTAQGHYRNNSNEVFYAVTCLDRPAESDPAVLAQRAQEWSDDAPTFGSYLAWSDLVCGQWPTPATGEPVKVTAEGANPILIVSTTHDPATPYEWAEQVNDRLASSQLVTWDADGHTAYGQGSDCVDKVVDAYLLDGTVPEEPVQCPEKS